MKALSGGLAIGAGTCAYVWMGYDLIRSDFPALLTALFVGFGAYFWLLRLGWGNQWRGLFMLALFFRLVLLFSSPALSDDYYRFLWDGRLTAAGYNPYAELPENTAPEAIKTVDADGELRKNMNSPGYFSVYTPLNQLLFGASARLGSNLFSQLVWLRVMLVLADMCLIAGLFFIGQRLKRPTAAALYGLNPLVVMEGVGNLHFEVITAALIVAAAWFAWRRKASPSALMLALAGAFKLTPLIYGPVMLRSIRKSKKVQWLLVAVAAFLGAGWWWMSITDITHLLTSVQLYFRTFEFNASLYYLTRWLGFQTVGYNPISITGWLLPMLGAIGILFAAVRIKIDDAPGFFGALALTGTLYLLFATTVHPWYIIPVIALATLSNLRFPILWSFLIMLSYGAYSMEPVSESTLVLFIQYGLVGAVMFLELYNPARMTNVYRKLAGEKP